MSLEIVWLVLLDAVVWFFFNLFLWNLLYLGKISGIRMNLINIVLDNNNVILLFKFRFQSFLFYFIISFCFMLFSQ
jgi:hypothetical protein